MKLTKNTLVPKIMEMKTEISIIDKILGDVNSVMIIEDELKFVNSLGKLIREIPKLQYFEEEMSSIKENLIEVFDGYETKEDAILYMNFMKKVIMNTKDYI